MTQKRFDIMVSTPFLIVGVILVLLSFCVEGMYVLGCMFLCIGIMGLPEKGEYDNENNGDWRMPY